jgi:anti-sigma-K factor RskA
MPESNPDLHAYALGEGSATERAATAAALAESAELREELERLEITLAALQALPQEEIPRRIAFVSDPVFQPSLWQRFCNSGPRLAFAGAGLLSCAILLHGVMQQQTPPPAPVANGITPAEVQTIVSQAVSQAVAEVETRAQARTRQEVAAAVAATEKRFERELQLLSATIQENETILRKQMNRLYVSNAGLTIGTSQE